MKKLCLLLGISLMPVWAVSAEVYYFDQPAQLTGVLSTVESRHPNPDFGGAQTAIKLNKPVFVLVQGEKKTKNDEPMRFIQLAYGQEVTQFIRKNKNRRVAITCKTLFEAHTAHHSTPALCHVDTIKLLK